MQSAIHRDTIHRDTAEMISAALSATLSSLADDADRDLYERTKRELVAQDWPDMNAYSDAKTAVIEQIKDLARSRRMRDA